MKKVLLTFLFLASQATGQGLVLPALIEGRTFDVLLDTGASHWVLSESTARELGLPLHSPNQQVEGVSGPLPVYKTWLRAPTLSGFRLSDQQAWVVPGNYPSRPLVGLSALEPFEIRIRHGAAEIVPVDFNGIIRAP